MKRLVVALLLVLLAGVLPLTAGLQLPRHVDPMELREEAPTPSSLFPLYSGILGFLAIEDWDRAMADLRQAARIYAPPDLRFIMRRFNELMEGAAKDLSQVKARIDNAHFLIEVARFSEARDGLEEARFLSARASRTVDGLESSAKQLGSMLRASPTPLLQEIARLRSLVDVYTSQIWNMLKRIDEYLAKPLTETVLTIQASGVKAQLGSSLKVEGFLTTVDGDPLTSRTVDIHFDGVRVGAAVTDEDGSYSFTLDIPYVYKDRVSLHSSYIPRGLDFGCYHPSSSDLLFIELMYDKAVLMAGAPRKAYPGLSLTVRGRLTLYDDPLSGFMVRVSGLGQVVETVTEADGTFSGRLQVPPDAPSGVATLGVKAFPRGLVGPASIALSVNVVRVPVKVEVKVPGFALSAGSLTVKGKASVDGGPLPNCEVDMRVGEWSSSTMSLNDGSFEVVFDIPLSAFTAQYTYVVLVSPREPWVTPSMREGSVFILNVFSVYAVPALVAAVVAVATWRVGKMFGPRSVVAPRIGLEMEEVSQRATEARKARGLTGLYWRAVAAVSEYTSLAMRLSHTIREYLKLVVERLGKAYDPFERLSLMYERWLYGPLRVREKGSLAKRCLKKLIRSLGLEG